MFFIDRSSSTGPPLHACDIGCQKAKACMSPSILYPSSPSYLITSSLPSSSLIPWNSFFLLARSAYIIP